MLAFCKELCYYRDMHLTTPEAGPGLGHYCDYWTPNGLVIDCYYPYKAFFFDNIGWIVLTTVLLGIIAFLLWKGKY